MVFGAIPMQREVRSSQAYELAAVLGEGNDVLGVVKAVNLALGGWGMQ